MIKLILALDEAGGIGKDNTLPWPHCSTDLKRFKALTSGHVVVMGSNTWNAVGMPKPLPKRINYILSNSMQEAQGATVLSGDACDIINGISSKHKDLVTWVIGGAKVIEQCWDIVDEFYITRIPNDYNCDVKIDLSKLKTLSLIESEHIAEDNITFEIYRTNK